MHTTKPLNCADAPHGMTLRRPYFLCGALGSSWLAVLLLVFASVARGTSTNSAWIDRVWQSDDGLPNNTITSLAQTPDGYLWVANPSRLARFDGVRFEEFSSGSLFAGYVRRISAVLRSRRGGLWVAMDHGPVAYLDSGTERVVTNGLPDNSVLGMAEDDEDGLWIAYRGGIVCRIKDGAAAQFMPNGTLTGGVCSFATDGKGRLWFAKSGQVGVWRDGKFVTLLALGKSANARLAAARTGGVWLCQGSQLFKISDDGKLQDRGALQADTGTAEPRAMLEARDGAVWIGTSDSGLFRYDGAGFESIPTSHRAVLSLAEDQEGDIWAGTGGGGLNRVQPQPVRLEGPETGLPFPTVQSICEDTNGVLWAVTQNNLLVTRTAGGWTTISTGTNWPGGKPVCVAAGSQGDLWVGTDNQVLYCLRDGRYTSWRLADGLAGRHIRSLLVSKAGDIWIGESSPENLQRFHAGRFENFKLPPDAGILRAMAEDPSGNIWIGTSKRVLLRVSGDVVTDEALKLPVPPRSIRSLLATPDGSLWIGYAGSGVGRYKDGRITVFTAEQGLYDDFISQMVADSRGWIWFGADHGIFKVRQQDFADVTQGNATEVRPVHYGQSAGLPSLQANYGNTPQTLLSRDGRVWMPMMSALAVADPAKLREAGKPSPVLLRRVAVDGQTEGLYGGAIPVAQGVALEKPGTTLRLPPSHHRVEFEFTAPSLAAPENTRFKYRLEGFDDGWTDAKGAGNASYSRLPAGDYRFLVKACNGDGVWTEAATSFQLTVTPFLWQTWWFRLGTVAVFTAVVIGIAQLLDSRRMRQRVEEINRRAALERSRMAGMAEIATSVLHNVGNVLNSVNISSTVIGNKLRHMRLENVGKVSALLNQHADDLPGFLTMDPKGRRLPEYLSELSNHLGREREDLLREVKSLAEGIEHIKNIVSRQQSYARASGVQESFGIVDVVEDAIRIHSGAMENLQVRMVREYQELPPVTMDKHKLLQIVINLISNAKHALTDGGASEKRILVRVGMNGGQRVKIAVIDNGIGISPENLTQIFQYGFTTRKDGHGFGLHSGALAARELGGSLTVQSDGPGRGAAFTLEFPLQPGDAPASADASGLSRN
jgi:ligand-binding sensor domain-containing protein/signal transduction histidine kinase